MIFRFFSLPKAKQFKITPRYYDPEQEEREERERRLKDELGIPVEKEEGKSYRPHIRGQFRQAMRGPSKTTEDYRRKSNRRLLILILILSMIFYFVFYR